MRISNVNTFSALIDRLIVENLKMIKFVDEKDNRASLQQLIIDDLKQELEDICDDINKSQYECRQECRTFTYNLLRLCLDHYYITKYDNLKLEDDIDLSQVRAYNLLVRECLEDRAVIKNRIDENFVRTVSK